jgi:hypothetical protein
MKFEEIALVHPQRQAADFGVDMSAVILDHSVGAMWRSDAGLSV